MVVTLDFDLNHTILVFIRLHEVLYFILSFMSSYVPCTISKKNYPDICKTMLNTNYFIYYDNSNNVLPTGQEFSG